MHLMSVPATSLWGVSFAGFKMQCRQGVHMRALPTPPPEYRLAIVSLTHVHEAIAFPSSIDS